MRISQGTALVETGSDPVLQQTFMVAYGVMAIFAVVKVRRRAELFTAFWPAWMMVVLSFASTFWSDAPDITTRRSVALFASTLFGHYLAVRFRKRHVRMLASCLTIALVGSLIFGSLSYEAFTETGEQALRGIFIQKNVLGRISAMAFVLFAALGLAGTFTRATALVACALALAPLILSQSVTGMATAAGTTLFVIVLAGYRNRWFGSAAIVVTLAVGAAATTFFMWPTAPHIFLDSIGRDVTLTGRTPLWEASLHSVSARPLLGHGFGAFWLGLEGASSDIWTELVWRPPHSHNGFLDLTLELGIVGLCMYLVVFAIATRRAVDALRSDSVMSLWPCAFFVFLMLSNVTESSLLKQHSLFWVLFVATSGSLVAPAPNRSRPWRSGVFSNLSPARHSSRNTGLATLASLHDTTL